MVLASFVIALRFDRDVAVPGLGGEALHGLFFEMLRKHDASFAEHLHDLKGDKPYSISGILTDQSKREGRIHIPADTRVEFRLGLLTDDLIEHTLEGFGSLAKTGAPVRFGSVTARVEGIAFQTGMHPLVRSTTYPGLVQAALDESRIILQFTSPTSFRAGDVQDILPKPERVFGSLLNAWQMFSPVKFDPSLKDAFALVRVSDYELRTELIHFTRYKVIGFKGHVSYTCVRDASEATRLAINALADFAFFAGVGYKTTMGLGQAIHRHRSE